ncbi:PH domain-containing protein [Erythrobacter sp. EC-HK427]|uniref:PH domain-containing protein n=1 Tax=Erythrobacter sp. EC-HK427 TaxID=2038396 RepID=UPI00125872D0|nr:PH domain-containing protein [Erythrobacter sp. EC-HK427]VVT04208.1 conserved membrane hypothetical protein [Erythrobacter sp. EC-HK427]
MTGEVEDIADAGEAIEIDEWRRVSGLSVAVQAFRTLGQAVIPAAFLLFGASRSDDGIGMVAPYAVPIIALIIAINLVPAWLGWYRLRYRIGTSDVRLEQGIVSRSARSVPYDRIQDVSLEQKLVPRLLGLVEVKFETGAGGKEELKLAYVSEAEGERLRETVRALVEGADGAEALPDIAQGQGEDHAIAAQGFAAPATMLFAMPPGRLFTYGLFSFSLVIFAVIIGAIQQFEFLLPFDVWDYAEQYVRDEGYFEAGKYLEGMDMTARILGALYILITVIGVGVLSGIAKTFVRDWDFRLERTPKGFRRRRGLLTKTDVVMPVHRVQALVVSTGIIRRRFGWHGLSFISLAQDSGSANHEVAPFARMAEIAPIAAEAGFDLPDGSEEWRRPSANYRFDKALLSAGSCILAAFAFLTAEIVLPPEAVGLDVGFFIMLALAVFFAVQQIYLWHYDRHALDPAQVISRRGWLAPRTQIANRVKLHSVEIAQGPIARWRGYCDLVFGMAGGNFAFEGLALEDAKKLRAAVLDSIASVDFANLPR